MNLKKPKFWDLKKTKFLRLPFITNSIHAKNVNSSK